MAQLSKLIIENNKLKRQLSQYQQILGKSPFIDDSVLKGGYRVVKNIEERDNIDCCHRKLGMKVVVIGDDLSFKEYVLKSKQCSENIWEEIDVIVDEDEVFLTEDYSELGENLSTQRDLNLVLKQILQNLQTQIDNIELTDEKVQITEVTNFAQIGQTQKDFNKNVSDYKISADSKNQEQDDRMSDIEGYNTAQDDLINDLNSELDSERARNDAQDSRLINLEGINYTWSPTNRTLTLFDKNGTQLSQVSLVSLDNEGTDFRYNATTLSLELYNADNELLDSIPVSSFVGSVGSQLQLNSNQLQLKDSQGNILSTVSFEVSNINGLQSALDLKMDKDKFSPLSVQRIPFLHGSNSFFDSPFYVDSSNGYFVGVNKTNPQEALDVNGNVKSNSYKFTLQSSVTPQPNMLVAKTDGSGLIWYDNNSIPRDLSLLDNLNIMITTAVDITNLTTDANGITQYGRIVGIDNSTNNINITLDINSKSFYTANYLKLGSGTIKFVAGSGTTLVLASGTDTISGSKGSTALVTRYNNEFILHIVNY